MFLNIVDFIEQLLYDPPILPIMMPIQLQVIKGAKVVKNRCNFPHSWHYDSL